MLIPSFSPRYTALEKKNKIKFIEISRNTNKQVIKKKKNYPKKKKI
jgi:hypothetical protein